MHSDNNNPVDTLSDKIQNKKSKSYLFDDTSDCNSSYIKKDKTV